MLCSFRDLLVMQVVFFIEKPAWTIIITFSAAVMNTEEESQQCQQHLYIITKFEAVESSECL